MMFQIAMSFTLCLAVMASLAAAAAAAGSSSESVATIPSNDGGGLRLRRKQLQQPSLPRGRTLQARWEEDAHDELVDLGIQQLENFPAEPETANFLKFWDSIDFRQGAYKGLEEADLETFGEYGGAVFSSHFYDPDTGRNYIGIGNCGFSADGFFGFFGMTAKDEGIKRMDTALSLGKDISAKLAANQAVSAEEYFDCGFELGLGLHYLTDLVQPMHAANFGNGFGSRFYLFLNPADTRHPDFEFIADDLMNAGYLDDTPSITDFAEITSVGTNLKEMLEDTAVRSKKIWTDLVEPNLPSCSLGSSGTWDSSVVQTAVDQTVRDYGYRMVAKYCNYFGRLAVA